VRPARARQPQNPGPTDKSFLLLFYKKEVLFFFVKKNQGRVPPRGVGAVGNSPAGATVQSLAQAGELSTAAVIAGLR
jgi:hypothetical protein